MNFPGAYGKLHKSYYNYIFLVRVLYWFLFYLYSYISVIILPFIYLRQVYIKQLRPRQETVEREDPYQHKGMVSMVALYLEQHLSQLKTFPISVLNQTELITSTPMVPKCLKPISFPALASKVKANNYNLAALICTSDVSQLQLLSKSYHPITFFCHPGFCTPISQLYLTPLVSLALVSRSCMLRTDIMKTHHTPKSLSSVKTLFLAAIKAQMWFSPTPAEAKPAPLNQFSLNDNMAL